MQSYQEDTTLSFSYALNIVCIIGLIELHIHTFCYVKSTSKVDLSIARRPTKTIMGRGVGGTVTWIMLWDG